MKNKSFTLIELLVVIAVIGLLASIVIVNLAGIRGKANIARGLQFSQSIHHALGSEAVGIWDFDEGSGNIAYDASGYSNNGTWGGSGSLVYTNGINKYAVNLPGGTTRPAIELASAISLPNEFTISFWFNTRRSSEWRVINNSVTYNYAIWHRTASRIEFALPGVIIDLTQSFSINNWEHIIITRDNNNLVSIYRNGELVGQKAWTGELIVDRIGGRTGDTGWNAFDGLIDEVRIYSITLSIGEIQQLYVKGAAKKGLAVK